MATAPPLLALAALAAHVFSFAAGLKLSGSSKHEETRAQLHIHPASASRHNLMICNAFAQDKPIEVCRKGEHESLTEGEPLAFSSCRYFPTEFKAGQLLDFKTGNSTVGTFSASALPRSSTTLLLVVTQKEEAPLNAKFMSHAFSDVDSAQVALMDASHSPGAHRVKLARQAAPGEQALAQQQEDFLTFDSVVAITPGQYKVSLVNGALVDTVPFQASSTSKHAVIRVGGLGGGPRRLVVFPQIGETGDKAESEVGIAHKSLAAAASPWAALACGAVLSVAAASA